MTGLLLFGVFGIWLTFVLLVATRLSRIFKSTRIRFATFVITCAVMLPLPVADELISAPQFKALCEENAKLKFDPDKIRGRTIFLAEDDQPRIKIGALNGYYIPWRYLDATTKEVVVTATSYHVKGGFFIRTLGISEKDAPLTMRSYCAPQELPSQKSFLDRYDLKRIQRSEVK